MKPIYLVSTDIYQIRDEDIDGASEFFLTITQMVIRGKAILTAQSAVATTGDAFLVILTQRITQQRQTARLRAAIPQIQGSPALLRLMKLSMAERLLALRVWITLDFKQYLDGYAWHALDSKRYIVSDPMKEIGAFRADAATLQALIAQIGSQVRPQSRLFRFQFVEQQNDSASHVLANGTQVVVLPKNEAFPDRLKKERVATFTIDPGLPVFSRFARIRTTAFRIFLQDIQTPYTHNTSPTVNLRVVLGQEMQDLSLTPTKDIQEHSTNPASSRILHFVTTESVFGFEYVADTKEVLMDGALNGEHGTSAMSPFRSWAVSVEGDTGLGSVDGLYLELRCDVTYV
jgi:hypothetical protein